MSKILQTAGVIIAIPAISMFIALLVCFVRVDLVMLNPFNWWVVFRVIAAALTFLLTFAWIGDLVEGRV